MQTLSPQQFADLHAQLQQACLHRLPGSDYLYLRSYSTDSNPQLAWDLRHPTKPFDKLLGLEPGTHHGSGSLAYDTTTNMIVIEAKVTEDPVVYASRLMASAATQIRVFARTKQEFLFARELPDGWYDQLNDALQEYNSTHEGAVLLRPVIDSIYGHFHQTRARS